MASRHHVAGVSDSNVTDTRPLLAVVKRAGCRYGTTARSALVDVEVGAGATYP